MELKLENEFEDSTKIVLASTAIRDIICTDYEPIHNALIYNETGTIKLLQAYGALQGAFGKIRVDHPLIGGDVNGIKTWYEWKKSILTFLTTKNNHFLLANARETLAHVIWTEHYDKLKYWPTIEQKEKKATLNIDVKSKYNYTEDNPSHIVIWSAIGSDITVKDTHDQNGFSTEISGELEISFVVLDIKKVNEIEENFRTAGNEEVYKLIDACVGLDVKKIQLFLERPKESTKVRHKESTFKNVITKFKDFFNIN